MEIEINGVKYKQKQINKSKPKSYGKTMTMLLGMAMMYEVQGSVGSSKPRKQPIPMDELVKEYELIQQKKSKLSRSQRDRVEHQFKKHFEIVEQSNQNQIS